MTVADEEDLFFHENYWKQARSVYRLPRGGGPYVEAFTTSGRVTLVGLDEANVYTLEEEASDAGSPASLRLVAHERGGGDSTPLAFLPANAGSPLAGALKASELLVLRQREGLSPVLQRHRVDGGQPLPSHVFAGGVMDIAFEGEDPIALEMTEAEGRANLVRVRQDGGAEVLLRSAPVFALDTPAATQIAVGGDSVVLGHKNCGGRGEAMCELTGEVYRVSLTSPKQEDLCRGRITPLQVATDGQVVYVATSAGLLELRP
ncbi:hypothetical protein F0U62_45880 [Cystobacter fuscus]|uniref:hypothetical protein n=1 Tax=Cystobacter fuscus TaxID=43 RepID=UPI002B305FFC|nr:hypothetical protein F0U62_45880 [Cystobacter fuscus]